MITLLADSNALRHDGLKAFLATSRNHSVALSDLILVEMRKSNALSTSRQSLAIAAQFPQQVYVLRRTDLMLDENIVAAPQIATLIDYEETLELASLAGYLLTIPEPPDLRAHMAQLEADAQTIIARLTEEVAHLEPGLADAALEFSPLEPTQIRTGVDVTDATRQKLFDLLKETIRDFILRNQDPHRRGQLNISEALGLFAFRYSLCMLLLHALGTKRAHRQEAREARQ